MSAEGSGARGGGQPGGWRCLPDTPGDRIWQRERASDPRPVSPRAVLAEQGFIASPAVAEGALYLCSLTHLVCIAGG